MADIASITEGLIEKVQIGTNGDKHSIAATAYGECNTPAATQVKTVNMTGFYLTTGVTIRVKFTYNNTSSSAPQLNVNGTGAKPIKLYGTTDAGTADETTGWQAGSIISFTYDGTNWVRERGYNTNTTYTFDGTYNSSTNKAATVSTVTNAINNLDVSNISGFGTGKTLKTLTETDGKIAATFQDIQITESQVTNLTTDLGNKAPKASPTFTGVVTLPAITSSSADTAAATKKYVDDKTAALTSAMHFIGITTTAVTDGGTENPTIGGEIISTKTAGDVVIYGQQEYVWSTTNKWELLGDENSYALKGNTDKAIKSLGFSQGSLPTLGEAFSIGSASGWNAGSTPSLGTAFSVPNVTSVGSVTDASVTDGTLLITIGATPTLGTAFSIPNVTSVGTKPSLTVTSKTIPNVTGVGSLPSVNPTSIDVVVP